MEVLRLREPRSPCGARASARFNMETTADSQNKKFGRDSDVEAAQTPRSNRIPNFLVEMSPDNS
jgi:hypothetical protein